MLRNRDPFAIVQYTLIAAIFLCVPDGSAIAQTWNIKNFWSDVNNPSGPFSLRFGNGSLLPSTSIMGGWSTPQPSWGSIPGNWFRSNGAETVGHDWTTGDIVTHTADSGNPAVAMVIRWTSPINGPINVSGNAWWGGVADQFFRANDWSINLNGVSLTGGVGTIGSGSGRGSGNPIDFSTEGSSGPNALTDLTVQVGDTVDLVISRNAGSYGGNGAYTPINYSITAAPEPGAAGLLLVVGWMATWRRRA